MSEKTKPAKTDDETDGKVAGKKTVKKRMKLPPEKKSYYYDDAYGYEIYNPDNDADSEDEKQEK